MCTNPGKERNGFLSFLWMLGQIMFLSFHCAYHFIHFIQARDVIVHFFEQWGTPETFIPFNFFISFISLKYGGPLNSFNSIISLFLWTCGPLNSFISFIFIYLFGV